jgi:hypothetical protein
MSSLVTPAATTPPLDRDLSKSQRKSDPAPSTSPIETVETDAESEEGQLQQFLVPSPPSDPPEQPQLLPQPQDEEEKTGPAERNEE